MNVRWLKQLPGMLPYARGYSDGYEAALNEVREANTNALMGMADRIEVGTHAFMEQYDHDGQGTRTRMSGESAALIVEHRSVIVQEMRKAAGR